MSERLSCGAARGVITPPLELIPSLRGLGDGSFGGVLDDLFVRVIALSAGENQALLIAFDLDKAPYPAEHIAQISTRTGIPEENISFLSIHTHTAPVTGFRSEEPVNDVRRKPVDVQTATAQYEKLVTETLLKVIDEAIGNMRPARMGYAYGKSYINVNRSQDYEYTDENGKLHRECGLGVNPEAHVERTLFVMKFEDLNGQPIAFFMNYPVHNAVLIDNRCCDGKRGLSSDLGGAVCRLLEEKFIGSIALWSSGAAGDVNPLILNEIFYPNPQTGRAVESRLGEDITAVLMMLSARHFADVLKVIRQITCTAESVSIAGTIAWSFTPGRNVVTGLGGATKIITGEGVDPYEIRLHLLRLGEIALLGFSGELYSALGRRLKEISPAKNTILINHDASLMARSGYIFDDETLARDVSNRLPGHRSSHILPGYVLAALEKQMLAMLQQSETASGLSLYAPDR